MTFTVFAAVMAAALLHAFWNALVKTSGSKLTAMLLLSLGNALVGTVVVAFRPLPAPDIWPWLLASGMVHAAYQLFLAKAYEHGDLSRVYPISRGTAPLIVLVAGFFLLPDDLALREIVGVLILGAGILSMARGITSDGESARLLPFALGAAASTAAYSLVDGMGARLSGDVLTFVGWSMILSLLIYVPVALRIGGLAALRSTPRGYLNGAMGGAASFTAYAIAVWAMTQAPIALVTALRESSILFAVLIGWLAFGERISRRKAISALLILSGIVLTRI